MALQFESYDGGNFMGNLYMNMLVGTAAEALEAGDFNEVDRVTSIMLKGDISYHVAYKLKGIAFQRMSRELDALVTFEDCLKYHPDDELWALLHKSKIEIASSEMLEMFMKDERVRKYYQDPVFLFTKGLKFIAGCRASNIRSIDHEDYQIWRDTTEVMLGRKLPEFKRGQDIIEEFERLFQNINNRNIERRIGNAFFKAQRYQYAIKKYEDAIKHFDGTDIAVYNNIAMCYYKLGQTEDASNNFDKCRTKCIKALVIGQQHGAQKKDISKAMARIGMCYECEKDYEKAIEWFEKSVAEHPGKDVSIRLAKLKKRHQK